MTNKVRAMFTIIACAAALMVAGQASAMSGKPSDQAEPIDYVVVPDSERTINRMIVLGDSLSDDGGDNSTWFLLKTLNGQTGQAGIDHMRPFVHSWLEERVPTFSWWCSGSWSKYCSSAEGGLLSALTKITTKTNAIPVIPKDHYDNGRWSNGPVWPEYLAPMVGINTHDKTKYINLSHAGGWSLCVGDKTVGISDLVGSPKTVATNMVNGSLIPPCLKLISKNFLYKEKTFRHDDLVVVFFGGNDYLNLYQDPARVVEAQKEIIEMAANNGAGAIAWLNMPDLANTPRFVKGSKLNKATEVTALINKHNYLLKSEFNHLQPLYKNKGVKLIHIDANKIFNDILDNFQSHGFSVLDEPCSTIFTPGLDDEEIANNPTFAATNELSDLNGGICANPNEYMFWDSVHPTTATHSLIADKACDIMKKNGFKCNK